MSLRDIKKLFSRSRMDAGSSSLEDRRTASKEDANVRKKLMSARREVKGLRQNTNSSAGGRFRSFGGRKLK